MKPLVNTLALSMPAAALALALAGAPPDAAAQSAHEGGYLVAAVGRTQYEHDCWFWSNCETARATFGKFGAGWRFGVVGVEGWWMDFGSASVPPSPDKLRLRATAINAVWYASFGPQVEGLLRAGVADVRHLRSRDAAKSNFAGTFGLGLVVNVAPAVALELGWDLTSGEGRNSGTTVANALSLGLRVRFP